MADPAPQSFTSGRNSEEDIVVPPSERPTSTIQGVTDVFNGGINPTFNVASDTQGEGSSQTTKTPHDDSTTPPTRSVGNPFLFVDQRAKVFRSHDKVLWFMFVSDVGQAGSSTNSSQDTHLQGSVWDENYTISLGDQFGKNMKKVIRPTGLDGVLLLTKCLDEYLVVHSGNPKDSLLSKNVFWASYYDTKVGQFKPITGVCYFDFWYDTDTHVLDLIFWSNVYTNVLNDKSKNIDDIYDGLTGPQNSDLFDTTRPQGPIQRVVFHCKGTYRAVTLSSKSSNNNTGVLKMGMTEEQGATLAGMYIFSKPTLLLNPGQSNQDTDFGDPVVDRIPFSDNKFVELK